MKYIDINCDVGEGIDNEGQLLPLISSCNIACGGHAGDLKTMTAVIRLAKKHKVRVGAHPSYPDRKNFGRLSMNISSKELIASIQEQLNRFVLILQSENSNLHHIKAHGALYNDMITDVAIGDTYLTAIAEFKTKVFLYLPYNSKIEELAKQRGFKIKYEAFADRNYNNDLSLVSRKLPRALLKNGKEVLKHVNTMINENVVKTLQSQRVKIMADTFCIHGDTPSAYEILTYLTHELPKHNVHIARE